MIKFSTKLPIDFHGSSNYLGSSTGKFLFIEQKRPDLLNLLLNDKRVWLFHRVTFVRNLRSLNGCPTKSTIIWGVDRTLRHD